MRELLRIRSDATSQDREDGRVAIAQGPSRVVLGPLRPGLRAALRSLRNGGATERELSDTVTAAEGEAAQIKLHMLLGQLHAGGWLERRLHDGDALLLTLHPLGHRAPALSPAPDAAVPLALSRFAAIRADGGRLVAESPRAPFSVTVSDPRAARLLFALAVAVAPADLDPAALGLGESALRGALRMLVAAGLVVGADVDEETGALGQWSFADLLFHARSRVGRHLGGYGGTYHRAEAGGPLPAVKPPPPPAVQFEQRDLGSITDADPPYGRVLEQRRSIRVHDDERPIARAQLGELLARCARVRGRFSDEHQELSSRPYPAGGALYELELYPLVSRCAGVDPGLYHYDPGAHALGLVAPPGPAVGVLVGYGRRTALMDADPQVLLLITARFGRAMWKYESMAYALVLKHVGVLYQTLYGAATAMGLAPCGLGGGDPDAFAAATGIDYYAEATVGEFLVGSRRAEDAPGVRPGARPGLADRIE